MSGSAEKIAYFFGWFILGPLGASVDVLKKKIQKSEDDHVTSQKRLVIANVAGIVSLLMKFQDKVTVSEIEEIAEAISRDFGCPEGEYASILKLLRQFLEQPLNFDGLVDTLPHLTGDSRKTRRKVFGLIVSVSIRGRFACWEQKLLLLRIGRTFDLPVEQLSQLFYQKGVVASRNANDVKRFYREFLGLTAEGDSSEVNKKYRKIAKMLHPDLHHDSAHDVERARISAMQELNSVYRFLSGV